MKRFLLPIIELSNHRIILLCALIFALPAQANERTASPLPRFASLRSAEANVRAGPGTRYPIQWVYRREGLPVEIVEEFEHWRKIRDSEGASGWVHKTMLDGRRTALIKGKEPRVLRGDPDAAASPVFKAEPGVIGGLMACAREWCRLKVGDRKGWLPKAQLWGVYPAETFAK